MTQGFDDLTFRPMTPADRELRAEAILRNLNRTVELKVRVDLEHPPLSEYLGFEPERGDVGYVVLADDRVIGVAAATFAHGPGHLTEGIPELWLHVTDTHRNLGLGGRLIDLILQDGRAADWPGVSLTAEPDHPARRLYLRKGFIDRGAPGTMVRELGPDRPVRTVAVYCGSSPGVDPAYTLAAHQLGHELARRGYGLVYGGGAVGLMGTVADAVVEKQGRVTGVIPRQLLDREMAHPGLGSLEIVETMAERKTRMEDLADAFIVLPGGAGTLEEFFEVLTMQQLGHLTGPVALCNTAGYWDPLITMLQRGVDQGFVREKYLDALIVADTPAAVLDEFPGWCAPGRKWD